MSRVFSHRNKMRDFLFLWVKRASCESYETLRVSTEKKDIEKSERPNKPPQKYAGPKMTRKQERPDVGEPQMTDRKSPFQDWTSFNVMFGPGSMMHMHIYER